MLKKVQLHFGNLIDLTYRADSDEQVLAIWAVSMVHSQKKKNECYYISVKKYYDAKHIDFCC